jgi:hypothetical protein
MFKPSNPDALVSQVAKISRSDRWLIHHRLQELMIPCWCPEDGSLWVEIHHGIQAILLRSTVQQLVSSRPELVDWLERCWETSIAIGH